VNEFLVRCLADRESGEEAPLEAYLALFPGHEEAIARKHAELRAEQGPAGGARAPASRSTTTSGR